MEELIQYSNLRNLKRIYQRLITNSREAAEILEEASQRSQFHDVDAKEKQLIRLVRDVMFKIRDAHIFPVSVPVIDTSFSPQERLHILAQFYFVKAYTIAKQDSYSAQSLLSLVKHLDDNLKVVTMSELYLRLFLLYLCGTNERANIGDVYWWNAIEIVEDLFLSTYS